MCEVQKMDIKIKGLAHVGIPTSDLEASRKFYESLGFRTLVYAPELEGNNFLFMECSGVIIGLPQSLDADTRALAGTKGAGDIDHFALYVDDIDATYQELKRRGCQFVTDGIVYPLQALPAGAAGRILTAVPRAQKPWVLLRYTRPY